MDIIIPEDEETTVFANEETTPDGEKHLTNEATDMYEYEDNHDDDNKNNNNTKGNDHDFQHQSTSNSNSSNNITKSDVMMSQRSENSSSRRRINVIATSTAGGFGSKRPNSTTPHSNQNHHNNTVLFRPTQRVVWYSPPRQRQKWGDTQVLPRVNWFDLFFDLFYVGATYNVSSILYHSPNTRGLLYAAGTFIPVMNIWTERTHYEGRYVMDDDIFHRLSIIVVFTLVGVTIANIRTVDVLSDATNESSMFFFALMLVIERIFSSMVYIEIYFYGVGQPRQMKSAAIRDCIYPNYSLPFFIAAMIFAAFKYFGDSESSPYNDSNTTVTNRRFTADTTSYSSSDGTTDLPVALCLIGSTVKLLSYASMIIFCLPKDGSHKEIAVPLNVDFILHRNGEWMMLMLGESIFSLLIVDVQDKGLNFYLVFYFSLLTVILLQLLHFQSQPHEADLHAVRRNKNRGMLWSLLQSVYSFSLVIMGASYTFFLLYADESDKRRRLMMRQLAGVDNGSNRAGSAHLYSGALAVVFLSLTIMNVLHKNSEEIQVQCLMKAGKSYAGTLAAVLRIGIVGVAGTISQWTLEPKFITLTGLLCVIGDLLLRKIELIHAKKHDGDKGRKAPAENGPGESDEASWPNVMHAAVSVEEL